MGSRDLGTTRKAYADWRALHAREATPEETLNAPPTDFELLYAVESHDRERLASLAATLATQVGQSLWGKAPPAFTEAVVLHVLRFCDREDGCKRLWTAAHWRQAKPGWYADAVLDRMFLWVAALLPPGVQAGVIFPAFARDVLLEVALAEAVKLELASSQVGSPALRAFHDFVWAKVTRVVPPQDREEIAAQAEEGLLGFGQAGGWGGRKTIQQFDRAQSSLAAFVIRPVPYLAADAHAPKCFHLTEGVLGILEEGGFQSQALHKLVGKSWQTWHGLEQALQTAVPALSAPKNQRWLERVRTEAAVFEARGRGLPAEGEDDPLNEVAAAADDFDVEPFETLVEVVLDPDRFEVFLARWRKLEASERMRLRAKLSLLKIIVLKDSIDELQGGHSADDGVAQLKFVLARGISTAVLGVRDGETGHLGGEDPIDDTVSDQMITRAGFRPETLVELGVKQLGQKAWDLWRLVYTVGFLSSLCGVDEATTQALASVAGIRDEQEKGFWIPLDWLSQHALEKATEGPLRRECIIDLVGQYGQALDRFLAPQTTLPEGAAALEISAESDAVVAHVAYPHVLLASYAPNAFAALYWNTHQGEQLSIDKMRSKLKDLRVSLESLRRFL